MFRLQLFSLLYFLIMGLQAQFTEPTEVPNGANLSHFARVIAAKADESVNGFTFSVTIESPDTGCEQFADWWEIIDLEGNLLYRRILLHSHVDEQPFTRSGGPVKINEDQTVWIRAHMNTVGYGGQTLKGSPKRGFKRAEMPEGFAADLEKMAPLPVGCDF